MSLFITLTHQGRKIDINPLAVAYVADHGVNATVALCKVGFTGGGEHYFPMSRDEMTGLIEAHVAQLRGEPPAPADAEEIDGDDPDATAQGLQVAAETPPAKPKRGGKAAAAADA